MSATRIFATANRAQIVGAALGVLTAAGIGLAFAPPARADFELHYPTIDYREFELEHNGDTTFDKAGSGKSATKEEV